MNADGTATQTLGALIGERNMMLLDRWVLNWGEAEGEAICPLEAMNASALTTIAVSRHVDFTV
jgi:hypothetical protein